MSVLGSRLSAGLDIGDYSAKLLVLHPGMGGSRFDVAEVPLPRPTPDAPSPPEGIAQAVADCCTALGLGVRALRGLTLGLSGSDVIVKQISLPIMDDGEVPGALRFEARKHLPFDPQSCMIDYQLLARLPSEKRLELLLAAVPQASLDRALAPLKLLGVDAGIVDAAPLALTNALSRGSERDTEARVLLDFGHAGSWLTLYQRGRPYFSRRLEFGGLALTRAIAAGLRVPFEEAEEWKLEAGADDSSVRVSADSMESQAMHKALEALTDELRRSFSYYRTMAPLPEPFTLWISGGTARLPGIAAELSALLDVTTCVFDPLESLGGPTREGATAGGPQFAQAYGLALRVA